MNGVLKNAKTTSKQTKTPTIFITLIILAKVKTEKSCFV